MKSATLAPKPANRTLTVYQQVKRRSLPIIEAYHDDLLKHDREWLSKHDGIPFLHYTRACGTHMIPMYPEESLPAKGVRVKYLFGTADRDHIARQVKEMAAYLAGSERKTQKLVLHFDGKRLSEVTIDEAVKIAGDYYWKLSSRWYSEARRP